MRRRSDRPVRVHVARASVPAFWPALAIAVATTGCGGAEVSLQVQPGSYDLACAECPAEHAVCGTQGCVVDTSELKRLHVFLRDAEGDRGDTDFPVDKQAQERLPEENVQVTKNQPFTIDVFGCTNAEKCGDAQAVFRGCTDGAVDLSEADTSKPVPVIIRLFVSDDDEVRDCPPKL